MFIPKRVKQAATVLVAFAMVATLVGPGVATADHTTEHQIEQLLAQIAALQAQLGGSSSGWACPAGGFTMSMGVGSTGADVQQLQVFLNSNADTRVAATGAGSPGNETMYYGPLTAAAVSDFHAKFAAQILAPLGLTAPTGYWGQSSIAHANSLCAGAGDPGDDDPADDDGELEGSAGDITIDGSSQFSSEEVGEGADDVEILAFDVEADDNSDVRITSLKVEFYQNTAADSQDLDDYASEVTVWFDGEQVGSEDADNFDEQSDDSWTESIALDDVIIRAGDEERITIAVSALNNLDSGDIDTDDWHVGVSSVRFTDADGAIITESVSLDITDDAVDDTVEQRFDFASFGTANDADLDVTLGDEDINDARVLDVDDSSHTDHDILSFMLEADGDSDIFVEDIPVVITTTGESDEAVIVVSATLYADGEEVGNEDVPTGGAVTFDDVDMTIEAGEEVEMTLEVELQETNGALDDGDTVQATVTVGSIDAEDEAGDSVTATGSAVGDAHAAYDSAFQIELVSTDADVNDGDPQAPTNDSATFTIVYDVTAFGADVYLGTSTDDADTATAEMGANYDVLINGSVDGDATSTAIITMDNEDTDGTTGAFKVEDGTTDRFTLTVNLTATEDNFFEIQLESLGWSTATGADDNMFTFGLEDFDAGPVYMETN